MIRCEVCAAVDCVGGSRTAQLPVAGTGRNHLPSNGADGGLDELAREGLMLG